MGKYTVHDKAVAFIKEYTIEKFRDYYYSHSIKEFVQEFNLSANVLNNILQTYNIPKKTKEQIVGVRNQTTLNRYGNSTYRNTEKAKNTKLLNYGNANYNNREKAQFTMKQLYGVEHALQNKELQTKRDKTNIKRHGSKNYNNTEKRQETCLEKYAVNNVFSKSDFKMQSDETKTLKAGNLEQFYKEQSEKCKNTKLERYGDSCYNNKDKAQTTCIEKYGVKCYLQSDEFKNKSKQTLLNKYGVKNPSQIPHIASKKSKRYITEEGIHLDSSWELEIYNFFKNIGKDVERNIPIVYEYNNRKHMTFIDFKVDGYLLECKASHLLDGCFDYAESIIPIDVKLDVYKKNHVILITNKSNKFGKPNSLQSNGLKYQNKCPNPLIGIDISLFSNPKFPFAEDRPECFYNVRVDGKPSSLEAWTDESLRWEMIKNRIEYSGGFIDSRQVLNAMNITRTCKQPSWFSKSLAKKIIQEYATTDIIADPFAGWGARHDATIELNKQYIGSDYNKELVEWHKSLDRDIEYKDANEFYYNGLYSVFICPPYSDPKTGRCFEDYNFEHFDESAKAMSQCDWLKLCMKNIPNAAEYIMVCKVVDEGFEQYIVDTKNNKSHFGLNKEYIIVIRQKDREKVLCL